MIKIPSFYVVRERISFKLTVDEASSFYGVQSYLEVKSIIYRFFLFEKTNSGWLLSKLPQFLKETILK